MKVKIVAILTLVILLLASVPVYAETPIPDPPAGAYAYWIVILSTNDSVYLVTSPNPINALYGSRIITRGYKTYELINGYWSYDSEVLGYKNWEIKQVYAANHDIAYDDGSGFFFTLPKVTELSHIVRQMKNKGTFGKILKDFSAGLIPLVGLIVLLIALTKAWAFLRRQLMH